MHHSQTASVAIHRSGFSGYEPCVTFTPDQQLPEEPRIIPIMNQLQGQRKLFYSVEVLASSQGRPVCLDFNKLLPMLPIFVSIAWLGKAYWDVEPLEEVESIVLAKYLSSHIPVLPHITAFRMTDKRMDEFINQNFSNVMAVRGDYVSRNQLYKTSLPMVEKLKKHKDDMSICVAGFPEGYSVIDNDIESHLENLKGKVNAGASCIITQVCYKPELIVQFVKRIRTAIPDKPLTILVGIMIHEQQSTYKAMKQVTGASLPEDMGKELASLKDEEQIRTFFVFLNKNIIRHVLDADISVAGIHFFTLNKFEALHDTLEELHNDKLFNDGKEYELENSKLS